jgi:hypothetical protein
VAILAAVLEDGLAAVEAACAEALGQGVHSASVILNWTCFTLVESILVSLPPVFRTGRGW